jgi:hypothetical protein
VLDLVNVRMGDADGTQPGSIAEALGTLAELRQEGLIRHLDMKRSACRGVVESHPGPPPSVGTLGGPGRPERIEATLGREGQSSKVRRPARRLIE